MKPLRILSLLPLLIVLGSVGVLGTDAWAQVSSGDRLVVAVSSENPPMTLSADEVADLFLSRRSRFPDGRTAVPVDQEETEARDRFYRAFAGNGPTQMKMYWSKLIFTGRGQPPKQVGDARDVKEFLAAEPDAIGYLPAGMVDDSVRVVAVEPEE